MLTHSTVPGASVPSPPTASKTVSKAGPGTGSRVHGGIGVNPPPVSTPCQYSRSESTKASARLIVVMSHLPRGVSPPPRVRRDFLALHQEGIGGEHRTLAHRHAVMG